MVAIRTSSSLWIMLVYCIVVTHLCAVFPVLGEQPNVAVSEKAQIGDRLSMNWHPMIRRIAYNEAFLGNSQLEEAEVSLLLAMAEISDMEAKDSQRFFEESLWKLFVSIPLNLDAGMPPHPDDEPNKQELQQQDRPGKREGTVLDEI